MLPLQTRSFWLAAGAVAYLCVATLQQGGDVGSVLAALLGLPLALYGVWRRTGAAGKVDDRVDPAIYGAMRAATTGVAIWVAARVGLPGRAGFDAIANAACGLASVAACFALARIPPAGGLLRPHPHTRSMDAAAFCGLLWSVATALPATRALFSDEGLLLDPLAIDYATTTASLGSMMVLAAASWRLRLQRRYELGVADRIAGALAFSLTALAVSVPATALDVAAPDRLLPVGVLAASLGCAFSTLLRDPAAVTITLRGVVAVMMLGTPAILLTALFAKEGKHPEFAALVGSAACVAVGLVARLAARPLGPEQSRWLMAIDEASRNALQPEPDAAITATLVALNRVGNGPTSRAELWRSSPPDVLSVDVAGYLHTREGEPPAALYELALQEPERALRHEVLRALEVRRPDTRPLLAWFETHGALLATVIVDEEGPAGFLLLPRGNRNSTITLEEARALRRLADRISALISVSSALARSRLRVLDAEQRMARLEEERNRLRNLVDSESARNEALALSHARTLRSTTFSAAARMTLAEVQRKFRDCPTVFLRAALGVDATAWAAQGHLGSDRRGHPFVVVDAADPGFAEQHVWRGPHSPLVLATGGTLVLFNADALAHDVQDTLVELSARAGKSTPLPTMLVFVSRDPLIVLQKQRRFGTVLASWVTDEIELPTLAERADDLRALVLDVLTRTAVAHDGQPLGIEPSALSALLEHTWPGNDLELRDVVTRAAGIATGPRVTMADLAAAGFRDAPVALPAHSPPAPAVRRRRRRAPRRP